MTDRLLPPALLPYRNQLLMFGVMLVAAIVNQTMAFLAVDRLAMAPTQAQPLIGLVLTAGAGAALLAQCGSPMRATCTCLLWPS